MRYDIRTMQPSEIRTAVDWAAQEGWNPGLQDIDAFRSVDPKGFFAGFIGDDMVASISVVNYDDQFSFLGFYIVRPEWRGQGLGYKLWQAALTHAGARVVGLDGMVAEQENYARSGFDLAWRNVRYGGALRFPTVENHGATLTRLFDATPGVLAQDAAVFPAPRPAFWSHWLGAEGHVSFALERSGICTGFVTLRPCQSGFKIGPLVAETAQDACTLLAALTPFVPQGAEVFLDVPAPNATAVKIALEMGMTPVFETARMYRARAPEIDLSRVFGITSFELG